MVHCEKTMAIWWAGMFGLAYLIAVWLLYSQNLIPIIIIGIFGAIIFGTGGALYYRWREDKHPIWAIWMTSPI